MAAIAHVAISLLFLAILSKMTKGELNHRHALIFAINSWFGPDIFGFLPYYGEGSEVYMFIHGMGWPIIAFIIAIPWFYVNNSNLKSLKPLKIDKRLPSDKYFLPYLQVFCLVAAGGIFHHFVDIISHPSYVYHPDAGAVVPWGVVAMGSDFYLSFDWMLGTGYFPCGNYWEFVPFYYFFGIAAPLMFILAFFVMPRNEGKGFLALSLLFFVFYTAILLGSAYFWLEGPWELTGGEADFGIMIFFTLFFFIPLLLLYWGYHGLPNLLKKLDKTANQIPQKAE